MRTRIISAFPGTGKSYFHKKNKKTTLDSDSSQFSWEYLKDGTKTRHPDFPQNYIQHIKENIGKYEFIFVSSHKVVRDALRDNSIFFYWVTPVPERKQEFIDRYVNRGNEDAFVKLLEDNWENWMDEFYLDPGIGCKKIAMLLPDLEDELYRLVEFENDCIQGNIAV